MLIFIVFFVLIALIAAAYTCLGIWVYRDAKSRGINAKMWTAVVLLVPNLMGLVIYFFVGRKQAKVQCLGCGSSVDTNSVFCPICGQKMYEQNVQNSNEDIYNSQQMQQGPFIKDRYEETSASKKNKSSSYKKFMVGFIILISLFFFAIIGIIGTLIISPENFGNDEFISSSYSINSYQSNIGNKWAVSFYKSTKTYKKTIKLKDGKPQGVSLNYKRQPDAGTATLILEQGNITKEYKLDKPNDSFEIDLSGFQDGSLKMYLSNDDAKDFSMNMVVH